MSSATVNPPKSETGTYTAETLAALLHCTVQHVRNMDHQGQIPGRIKFGRLVRWSKQRVDEWLSNAGERGQS